MPKMSGAEAKDILVDVLINILNNTNDIQNVVNIWDEDEAKDLVAALRVMAGPTLAKKVKQQLC